jgi:hypothetical protein
MNFAKIKNSYVSVAIIVFNLLAIFVVLNSAIAAGFFLNSWFKAPNAIAQKYSETELLKVYPGKSRQQVDALLGETWSRPYVYESFTQFKEPPFRGHYVNVDGHGFRFSADQAPWPPDPLAFNVFVFGGSTTFGYGVADTETVPSFLQEEIRARSGKAAAVYNFGRGYYYSTQERVLFEKLLAAGHSPRLAIFVDGLNEFHFLRDEPAFTKLLADFMTSHISGRNTALSVTASLPVGRLIRRIVQMFSPPQEANTESAAREVLNRYWSNKKLIEAAATAYGVVPVFVWQPTPAYKYDQKNHLFAGLDFSRHTLSAIGYRVLAADSLKKSIAGNFLQCANIQEKRHEPLYVDQVHYTAAFSKDVATCIADQMQSHSLFVANGEHPQ